MGERGLMRARMLIVLAVALVIGALASPARADGGIERVGMHNVATVKYLQRATNGGYIKYLPPGGRAGGVIWVTANTPFYVTVTGGARMCLRPGQLFYPNNGGLATASRIEPTVRCR